MYIRGLAVVVVGCVSPFSIAAIIYYILIVSVI